MAVVPQDEAARQSVPLPIGLRRLDVCRAPLPDEALWVYVSRRQGPDAMAFESDLLIFDQQGNRVLTVDGLQIKCLEAADHTAPIDELAQWFHSIHWQEQERPAAAAQPAAPGTWLIFSDCGTLGERLAERLNRQGHAVATIEIGDHYAVPAPGQYRLNPGDPAAFARLLMETCGPGAPPCRGIVYLWSSEAGRDAERSLQALRESQAVVWQAVLFLLQALAQAGSRDQPRLWLITRGAETVTWAEGPPAVAQTPLVGLSNVLAYEFSQLRCGRIDLDPLPATGEDDDLFAELCSGEYADRIALRAGRRYIARLTPFTTQDDQSLSGAAVAYLSAGAQPFRLELTRPGALDRMTLRAIRRPTPGPDEVEIKIHAWGLNFHDVLVALDVIPDIWKANGYAGVMLGRECAGTVVAVGERVTDLAVGQAVIAMIDTPAGSHALASRWLVVPRPAGLTFEQAATLPIALLTAYYSLVHAGRLAKGERVLIHAATGGVGLAAIHIARQIGAEIFATAGTPEKRALLRDLGIEHVMDSRSLAFVDEVQARTGGEGVDVVLNSLSGEFLPASLGLLRDRGRFVEIGKRDYYADSRIGLRPFLKGLVFTLVDLETLVVQDPQGLGAAFKTAIAEFGETLLTTRHYQVFPMSQVVQAFQTMAQARHIGKIVIAIDDAEALPIAPPHPEAPAQVTLRDDATYLISGGLGGIGLVLARRMVERGVRHLMLLGRGAPSQRAEAALADLRAAGATVRTARVDIAELDAVVALLDEIDATMPPLRGVIHAAGVLDDGLLLQQTTERFRGVMAPKIDGAWNLHTLTRDRPLDLFVLFSSAAAVLGSPGQGNYAAANAFLDGLAAYRRAQELPAISIAWGPWAEVGLAASRDDRGDRIGHRGLKSLSPDQALDAFERVLQANPVQIGVFPFNLRQWLQYYPRAADASIFGLLLDTIDQPEEAQRGHTTIRQAMLAEAPEQRLALLERHLFELVSRVLRIPTSRLERTAALGSIGLDSLMALELRNLLEDSLGMSFPVTLIWNHQSIAALAAHLAEKIGMSLTPETEEVAAPSTLEDSSELTLLLSVLDEVPLEEVQQALQLERLA